MKRQFSFTIALSLASLLMFMPAASAIAAQANDTKSVSEILQEVKVHAGEADYDAEVLDSYTKSGVSWESHSICLNEIRRHVNDLFQDYSRLQKVVDKASPKQREAINRLEPMLRKMAGSLIDTIQDLHENQKNVNVPSFRARIHSNYLNIDVVYRELCNCTGAVA